MPEKLSPFEWINQINSREKKNLIDADPDLEKQYLAFMVNRGLSMFKDTVLVANEMNIRTHAPKKCQNDFLLNMIRPGKRFAKWPKKASDEDLKLVCEYYNCNRQRGYEYLSLFTGNEMDEIRRKLYRGGVA